MKTESGEIIPVAGVNCWTPQGVVIQAQCYPGIARIGVTINGEKRQINGYLDYGTNKEYIFKPANKAEAALLKLWKPRKTKKNTVYVGRVTSFNRKTKTDRDMTRDQRRHRTGGIDL